MTDSTFVSHITAFRGRISASAHVQDAAEPEAWHLTVDVSVPDRPEVTFAKLQQEILDTARDRIREALQLMTPAAD